MWFSRTLGDNMGSVIVTFKIMPESTDTDLDKIEQELRSIINPQKIERQPIAFGLNSIRIVKLVDEKEGEMDRITKEIQKINGVREVEVVGITRSL